ncbi:MAG: inorganic phosphate transporter, partial [Niabella sp.]
MFTYLIVIIALALIFDYINGFHDAANSIATVVSTKVLTPLQAVTWAAFFNFLAYFIFDHGVAQTVSQIVNSEFVTLNVIFSGLIAAISWNLLTWWFGIPSSSSHTLIGGFAGAGVAHAYFSHLGDGLSISEIVNMGKIMPTVIFIVLAPLIGMIVAFLISIWFLHSFSKTIWPRLISVLVIAGSLLLLMSVVHLPEKEIVTIEKSVTEAKKDYEEKQLAANANPGNIHLEKAAKKAKATIMVKQKDLENANKLYNSNKPYPLKVVLFGHNMKWFLLAFILIVMAVFSM